MLEVSNLLLGWQQPGQSDALSSPFLYALNGQEDSEGPVNFDIYAAFNRTIGDPERNGSGVGEVIITLLPPAVLVPIPPTETPWQSEQPAREPLAEDHFERWTKHLRTPLLDQPRELGQ